MQFLSSGLAQRGKDDEEFDGFLIKDIKKEISRAKRLVSKNKNSPGHLFVRYRHSSLHLRPLNFLVNSLDFQSKIQNNTHLMINFL